MSETKTPGTFPADVVAEIAKLCHAGEAAVLFDSAGEGLSYCVASEPTALAVAQDAATTPPEEGDTLLAVAVVHRNGTVTGYPVKVAA